MERDAEKDLQMCDLATPGPWFRNGEKWCSEVTTDLNSGAESWGCQLWYRDDSSMVQLA
ncbi:hypothetical protein BBOR36S_03388 [Brevibacillus borstelensis]|jgi:hypothetical protein|nr:hypothetical protein BBO01nite_50560 [Brevibacillus borstelensis]